MLLKFKLVDLTTMMMIATRLDLLLVCKNESYKKKMVESVYNISRH
jgi:hypothetical protein